MIKDKVKSSLLCFVVAACLSASLFAQDQQDGPPGGPPPDEPGDIGPGGPPVAQEGTGQKGGPPPNFDPAKFQQRFMEQARQNLNVTNDQEWTVIQPLVQNVMEARREANIGGMRPPGMGGPDGRGPFGAQANPEQQDLQKAVGEGGSSSQIKDALAKYRAARKEKQSKLETAQGNLRAVLTVKQEAQAVLLGLLP